MNSLRASRHTALAVRTSALQQVVRALSAVACSVICSAICFIACVVSSGGQLSAQTAEASHDLAPDEVDWAVERGVAYLLSKQRKDGSITDRQYETTMTAWAIMAMASTGVTPSEVGVQGEAASRALDFVLLDDRIDKDGYYGNRDGSRM